MYLLDIKDFHSLLDGASSGIWADSDLHYKFPCGEDNLWALWTGPEDLPEPQGEVCGEEHRPGLRVREGVGGAVQTCGRTSLITSRVHWWTLPWGPFLLLLIIISDVNLVVLWIHNDFKILNSSIEPLLQGAEKILGMNESGELQDLLTKIEVGFHSIFLEFTL